ncbi:putative secondary metabolism biosynthetic enzyme [Exophiala dermatitidis]|nr:putative secondary metabolism biosynthetic enzyme [Exophiala dermatitidis]KAJ4633825.1 putative secondary metabolism biosynthetic enzyme [Exophiala dermatitidis]KAJ4684996.1 putative secondary metabolism biosynthetic enzyme [Exophiala dermatitidis]
MFPKAPSDSIGTDSAYKDSIVKASHIEVSYNAETGGWGEPRIVQDPWLRVHGLSPGLNYGQQCYEGVKACRTADNRILIFRPEKHAARMVNSAKVVSIPPLPEAFFVECLQRVVGANSEFVPPHDSNALLYIRPILFGSSAQLALTSPKEFTFCVYIQPGSAYHGVGAQDAVVLEEFDRAAPRGVGNAKVGGNYAPVMRFSDAARKEGYALTLHLDSATRTEIDEFSTSSFIGVRETQGHFTLVVPNSPNVLPSVTSDTCVEMAKSLGWTVEKRSIKWDELPFFSEVMAVGTATLLLPIGSITRKSTGEKFVYGQGNKNAGPCCHALREAIDNIMRGKAEDTKSWCTQLVEFPTAASA